MLVGTTPFRDDTQYLTLKKIKELDYALPSDMDEDAKELLQKIFRMNSSDRPSCVQLMSHPFFDNVDFERLYDDPAAKVDERSWREMLRANGES